MIEEERGTAGKEKSTYHGCLVRVVEIMKKHESAAGARGGENGIRAPSRCAASPVTIITCSANRLFDGREGSAGYDLLGVSPWRETLNKQDKLVNKGFRLAVTNVL